MEKHEAQSKGYSFTGVYERNKEIVKSKQQEYKGYKTVICPSRASGYERNGSKKGSIQGYCLYIEAKFFKDKLIQQCQEKLSKAQIQRDLLKKEYEAKLVALESDLKDTEIKLAELTK